MNCKWPPMGQRVSIFYFRDLGTEGRELEKKMRMVFFFIEQADRLQ